MSKDQAFDLMHYLQKEQPHQNYFTNMAYLANCTIHIIIYFSFPAYSFTNLPSIASEATGIVILASFMALIVVQIVLFLTKKKEIYLRNQLLFFRFIVSPILTFRLIENAQLSMVPPSIAALGVVLVRSFSYFLSKFILYENERHYSLKIQETSLIAKMEIVQLAIILHSFINQQKIQFISAIFMLLFCYYVSYPYLGRLENEEISYKILAAVNMSYLLMLTFYVGVLMLRLNGVKYFFTIFIPSLMIGVWSISKQRRLVNDNMILLLSKKLNYREFIQSADAFLMILKQDSPSRKRIIGNYLIAIFSAHSKSCDMPGCEIQSSSTKQQLRSLSSKCISQLTLKALKKFQWIFEEYHSSNSDSLQISFALLKFYGQFLRNKAKMQNLLGDIEEQELGLAFECEYSKYKKICTDIQNVENIDVIKDEDIYLEFRNTMISTLNLMIEFWAEFGEERVDLAKITAITAKLFPLKAKLEEIFKNELAREKFTTYRILKLYSSYTRRILHRWEQAAKVQDFLQILAQRLKDKQDIQFLSKESEAGFVVICLSESKLGNIFMVNQKACTIFKYAKKDILNLRVNAIMPTVFADIHDQILTDFLKKKRKKYNTDQRLLFGKDGNGYIFPLMLQLQRASFSANDEFIFIASVAPAKLKSAPNYCIVNQQGAITDYTSTFRVIFYQKSKNDVKKNIQQIIPSYFEDDFSESLKLRHFSMTIDSKRLRGVQANAESIPLIVKGVHQGFLIKISYDHEKTLTAYKHLCITDNMKNIIITNQTKSFENIYQSNNNYFQIEGGKPHHIGGNFRKRQFTLPFLNYEDMAIFAQPLPVKKDYGKGIKMVRYIKNHFERIEDDDSFHSETYKDHHQETLKQIENMQVARKKSESSLLIKVKALVGAAVFVFFIVLGLVYQRYQTLANEEKVILQSHHRSKIIFVQLSQYIVSYTCEGSNIYPDFFRQIKQGLKETIIVDLNKAQMSEFYKQEMTRILYLQSSSILLDILNDSYQIQVSSKAMGSTLDVLWGAAITITLVIIFIFPLMFYQLKSILFQIYLLFIDIKDPVIKKIDSNCHSLITKICLQIQQNVEKEEERRSMDLEEEGELEKKRRFKNTERSKDLYMFIKITTPLLLIVGLLFFALFFSRQKFNTYQLLRKQHGKVLEVIPSASIQFMKMTLRLFSNLTITVANNYEMCYQEFQSTVRQFTQQIRGNNFLDLLYGDICTGNKELFKQMAVDCEKIGFGIMTHGVSPTVNYISQNHWNKQTHIQPSHFKTLFLLQFFFINPTITYIEKIMFQQLCSYLNSLSFLFQSIALALSCLMAIFYLYLIIYPLSIIQQEITFTSEMIALVPEGSQIYQDSGKSIAISQNLL